MKTSTIVVGAGSGGGALAARLSEDPEHQVTVIEAGPDFATEAEVPEPIRDAYEMSVEGFDWDLEAFFIEPAESRDPQPYPRGRVVGGSSSVNATIAQRATVEDHEAWAAAGNAEWSWEKVLPYYKRLETDLDFGESEAHGGSGPIPIFRHTKEELSPGARAFVEACVERGFAETDDLNAPGATGVGLVPRNQIGTLRASALVTYVKESRGRPNFELRPDTLVTRVLFDGTRATGVELRRPDGETETLSADRVVLAAGAVHTPHLLMLSGIGPAAVLAEHGIETVVESPGVGQNFQDHPFVPVMTLMKEQTDAVGVRAELKFTTADARELVDDMMLFGSVLDPATMNMDVDTKGKKALTLVSLLAKPRSVGWLTLASADPEAPPELHVNLSSDRSDIVRLMESVRLAFSLATESQVLVDQIEEVLFPDAATVADDEALEAFIRSISNTSYHASATCRMGPEGDPLAVVDQGLAVNGTEDLFIADASVFPAVPTGLTNLAAYMVGERAADLLRERLGSGTALGADA